MIGARGTVCALATAGTLLAGCSSSSDFSMSSGAGATVRSDVLVLTTAVADHKWTAADAALAQLSGDITAAVAAGQMSDLRARVVRADVAMISADLAEHRAATRPLPPLSSSTAKRPKQPNQPQPKQPKPRKPTPPKPHHDGHGPGHGHGEGD